MDVITQFQHWAGPVVLGFVAHNADLLKTLVILFAVVTGAWKGPGLKDWLAAFIGPKGTSDGKGDLPRPPDRR
jgi:hypothetical protein